MQVQRDSHDEYLLLGRQLKQTTQVAIAEKFNVRASDVSLLGKLGVDDVRLIHAMLADRDRMLQRRKQLRFDLRLCS
jgi:hypothetical protein